MRRSGVGAWMGCFSAATLAVMVGLAGDARADDKKADEKKAENAEKLADQGYSAYEAGKFKDAISFYMKAFHESGDARLLYNVATIYDKKLHERPLAEDFYRRYIKSPQAEPALVKKSNERIAEMKVEEENPKPAAPDPAPPPPVAAPPPPPPPVAVAPTVASSAPLGAKPFPLREAGVVVGGVGVVLVVVGSAFGISALSKSSDVSSDCPNDVCRSAGSLATRDEAQHAATASTVFWGLGLAAIGGGVAMVLLDPKTKEKGPFRGLFHADLECRLAGCGVRGTF